MRSRTGLRTNVLPPPLPLPHQLVPHALAGVATLEIGQMGARIGTSNGHSRHQNLLSESFPITGGDLKLKSVKEFPPIQASDG